jgi:hypothetical protein
MRHTGVGDLRRQAIERRPRGGDAEAGPLLARSANRRGPSRAASGPVTRCSAGKVEAMTASEASSPPMTLA